MKWYHRPHSKLVLRLTKYTIVWMTLSLFLHEMAWFVSAEAKYTLDRTAVDYLIASMNLMLLCAIKGIVLGIPVGIALGSIADCTLRQVNRGQIRPKQSRRVLGLIVILAILPAILVLPETISLLHGDKARLIGLMMILPLGLALRWSQQVAAQYISDRSQNESSSQTLHPRTRMILRTSGYCVLIGVPVLIAYTWLFLTVADRWYTVDGPIFLLFMCLVLGAGGFALLGGIFGAIMATVAKLARGRIKNGARLRALASLAPLLFLVPWLLPIRPAAIELFWWKLQIGNPIKRLEVAGLMLAIAIVVGICQIVFAKHQRETSPPKNDRPLSLWPPLPLVATVLLIVVCSVIISVVSRAVFLSLVERDTASTMLEASRLLRAAQYGISVGLFVGSAIAVTIMLQFSEIRRANVYRLTIAGVTLASVLLFWGSQIHFALLYAQQNPSQLREAFDLLAKAGLITIASVLVAEIYRRATTARAQIWAVSENEMLVS